MGKSISPSFQTAGSSVKSSTQKPHVHCKRGNVEINNSPQAGIEPGASRFKNSTE